MGDGMLSLFWNNHKATFCHILATLREKERYTDATLACDGKFYPVHKLVLSTCSEYFEKMFEHTPCKHPVIVLKDIKADALEALLNYMYAGYVNVAQNDLARLIKAAEMLQIKGLAVPDEPPVGEESRGPGPARANKEERTSPQPKRRRRDEASCSLPSNSPPTSPRVSPYPADMDHSGRTRAPSDSHRLDRLEAADQVQEHPATLDSQASDVKVMVDESLVKEEIVEPTDNTQSEDSRMQYNPLPNDPGMDGTAGAGEEHSSHMVPNQQVIPGQGQPLADAVAEALAGPSGMQGWLGGSEIPGTGGYGAEVYSSEGSQEVHPSQAAAPHTQQRVGMIPAQGLHGEGRPNPAFHHSYSTDKPHRCNYCSYSTNVTTNLKNHTRIHTGEKPFCCSYCPFSTTQKGSLRTHIRTHTGEKPYACPFCDHRSSTKGNLNAHLAVHRFKGPANLKLDFSAQNEATLDSSFLMQLLPSLLAAASPQCTTPSPQLVPFPTQQPTASPAINNVTSLLEAVNFEQSQATPQNFNNS